MDLSYIPEILTWQDTPINSRELHMEAFRLLYSILDVENLDNETFRIRCGYYNLNEVDFDLIKNRFPTFEKDPLSLFKLCMGIVNPPQVLTVGQKDALTALMVKQDLNHRLQNWAHSHLTNHRGQGQPIPPQPSLCDSLMQYAKKIATLSQFLVKKTQRARKLAEKLETFVQNTEQLKINVSAMIVGQTERLQNFNLAAQLVELRKEIDAAYDEYLDFTMQNYEIKLLIFNNMNYTSNVHFTYDGFKTSFQDKTIWFIHHFKVDRQLEKVLLDPTLFPISNSLDSLTLQIHQFQQDENSLNSKKAARIKGRINEFINDFNDFTNIKTENTAKILKSTSTFLLKEIEVLSLKGIDFNRDNFGISREVLENKIGEIESYLLMLSSEREKQNNENKSAASEISKTLSLSTLPTLKSPVNFLHWRAALNRLFQFYKSDLSRTALIKSSVIRQTDKRRLDTMSTSKQMIDYLTQTYGQLDLILPLYWRTLTSMPLGIDAFTVQRNYEEFLRIVQLLKDNNIVDKLDRFIIESLVSRILTQTAREQYFTDLLKKEPSWKVLAGLDNSNSAVNTNEIYEKYRQEHFLNFASEAYETVRRLSTNQFFENQLKSNNKNRRNNTKNYSNDLTDSHKCIFCSTNHPPTLIKCPNFNKWKPEERLKKINSARNYCKKCLYFVKDWQNHKAEDGKCKNQARTGACNKCNKFTHHSYLHVSGFQSRSNFTNNDGSKKSAGNQFKRPNRSSRFAKSTKVSMVSSENSNSDSIIDDLNQLQVHTNRFSSFYQSNDKQSRTYVTCVTIATIVGNSTNRNVCLMLDSGSQYNFGLERTLRELGYTPFTHWEGEISTLTNISKVNLPVFQVTFQLYDNSNIKIPVLGLKNIGFKQKMNDHLFNTLVKETKIDRSQFSNIGGNIQIMVGIRSGRLLPNIKKMPYSFVKKYPDLKVCFSPISKKYFFSGYFTHSYPSNVKATNAESLNSLSVFTISIQKYSDINQTQKYSDINQKDKTFKRACKIKQSTNFKPSSKSAITVKRKLKKQGLNPIIKNINNFNNIINPYPERYSKEASFPIISQQFFSNFMPIYYTDAILQKFTFELMQKEALDYLRTHCLDCSRIISLCKKCRYLNSSLSLDEQRQMNMMLQKIRVSNNNTIYVDFLFNIDPKKYFTQEHSNYSLALKNSLKLRKRLERLSLLPQFQEVMENDIKSGYIEPISNEELKNTELVNYISLNFSQKPSSTSTKLRIVSNCSFVARAGKPLNNTLDPGPNLINLPNNIIHELRFASRVVFGDLEKAYRKLKIENHARNYLLFIWFSKINDETTVQTYRYSSLPFGLSQSGTYLELALRHIIAQECKLASSKNSINLHRYIDDYCIMNFENSSETLSETIQELTDVHEKYNFKFKELHYSPINGNGKKFNIDNTINFLTLKVCLDSDLIIPSFTINASRKFRGSYLSSSLSLEQIRNLKTTKKLISKILGQVFSFSNFFLEPINCVLKIFFTLCCKITDKWDANIESLDKDFVSKYKKFLTQLINIENRIKPVQRCILETGHSVVALVAVSDASIYMLGSIIYLITEDSHGNRFSNIVDAKSKVSSRHNVVSNECLSIKLCINLIHKYLLVIGKHITNEFSIHINNDSKSVSYWFDSKKSHSNVLIRNCVHHIYRSIDCLFTENKHLKLVTMNYIPTDLSSADEITKITNKDILEILNSSKYRKGSEQFIDKNFPHADDTFFKQERDKDFQFFPFYNYKPVTEKVQCKKTYIINCNCLTNKVFHITSANTSFNDISNNKVCHIHCINTCQNRIHNTFKNQNIPILYNRIQNFSMTSTPDIDDEKVPQLEIVTFDISTDFYKFIFSHFNKFTKLINTICIMKKLFINFKLTKRLSIHGHKMLRYQVFLSLIKKHQSLFPINNIKSDNTQIIGNIKFISLRLNFTQMNELYFIDKIPIFNTSDRPFLNLLIDHAHVKYNYTVRSSAHMTKFLTQLNMGQNTFAIFAKNIGKYISNFISKCTVCCKLNKYPFQADKSNLRFLRFLTNPKPCMFQYISIDTLPCIGLRLTSLDKKSRNLTLYMIQDLLTGYITCYLAENSSLESTRQVLSNLTTQWNIELKYILSDAGVENQLSENDDIFKSQVELVKAPPKCQQLNNIESNLKIFKRIFFSIFNKTSRSWPSLTLIQFNSVIILTLEILNSRPMIKQNINDEFVYFSPNSLVRGYTGDNFNELKFKDFLRLQKVQENFSDLIKANSELKQHIFSSIKNTLAISTSKLAKKYYKHHSMLKPKQYDICLKNTNDGNFEICRIIDMNNKKNFLTIEIVKYGRPVRQGCHINNLSLLYRNEN